MRIIWQTVRRITNEIMVKKMYQSEDLESIVVCTENNSYGNNFLSVNPLTPMSDQDRLSPYNINTISTR